MPGSASICMQKKKPGSVEVRREQRQETIFRGVDNSTLSCMHRARGLPYSLDIGKLRLSPWLSTASTAMATPHADSTLASQNIHPQARPLATTTTTTPVALPPPSTASQRWSSACLAALRLAAASAPAACSDVHSRLCTSSRPCFRHHKKKFKSRPVEQNLSRDFSAPVQSNAVTPFRTHASFG